MLSFHSATKTALAAASLALAAGCATTTLAAVPQLAQGGAICAPPGERLRSLEAAPADNAAIAQTIKWAPNDAPDLHSMAGRSIRLSGPCATTVSGYNLGETVLATGEGFTFLPNYQIAPSAIATRVTAPTVVQAAPSAYHGARFVAATRVQYVSVAGELYSDYLGLWNSSDRSIVASFRVSAKGKSDEPRILFESSMPLRSVSFFPSPDAPSGTVSVSQVTSLNTTHLFTYQWNHSVWFADRK